MAREKIIQKILFGVAILFFLLIANFFLIQSKSLEKIQLQTNAFLYQERQSSTPIILVGVDQYTSYKLGQSATWTRDKYAKVIENLSKYEPAVIGLDYFFISKGQFIPIDNLTKVINENPNNLQSNIQNLIGEDLNIYDQELAQQIKNNDKLILIYSGSENFKLSQIKDKQYEPNIVNYNFIPDDDQRIGTSSNWLEKDGSIRNYLPVIPGKNEYYNSFGLAIIAKYLNSSIKVKDFDENHLSLEIGDKNFEIPMQNYQFLINFSSKLIKDSDIDVENANNTNFKYLHFADVYEDNFENFDSEYLKDKIILIGPYTQTNDIHKVPIDHLYEMPGVQIHGQAIQTILDQAYLKYFSTSQLLILITLFIAISLIAIFTLPITWAIILLIILNILYLLVIAPWAFRNGYIVDLIYPSLNTIFTAILTYAYRYLAEFKQKNKVALALGQYVNEEVKEKVLTGNFENPFLNAEKKDITVLFTDIKDFTNISEKLHPQSIVAMLNEYFEVMGEQVIKNKGVIDKYQGDALMAYFKDENHQLNACKAALGMRKALPQLMEKWKNDDVLPGGEKKPMIDFRVGISSGEAILGNMGATNHIQYTVIGDIVNLGSRLEGANKKYQTHVMVAEATFEKVADQMELRFLDIIRVKGKDKAVKIYELLGEKGSLNQDQIDLIQAYNYGLNLYFDRKFKEAKEYFENQVLKKWPRDYMSNVYAARAQKCILFPPDQNWDFVFKMEGK